MLEAMKPMAQIYVCKQCTVDCSRV